MSTDNNTSSPQKYKILIADKMSDKANEIFARYPELKVDIKTDQKAEELCKIIGDYDAVIVRSATTLTGEILSHGKKLKVAGRAGIGVDNIDLEAANRLGIVVMNTPDSSAITTAEHTLSLMMSLVRNIPQGTSSMKNNQWLKNKLMGREIYGKTLGIVGFGNIGRRVAERALGLGMKVMTYDPYTSKKKAMEFNVELVDLDTLLEKADIFTCHTPLTDSTRNLFRKETMDKMKKGSYIINCARGGIVHEGDLAEALKSGKLAGAAFDVFEQEPPPADHPLMKLDNFICTPHLGASTTEAQTSVAIAIAEQISSFLITGEVKNALNYPSVPAEMKELLLPYLSLGEKMGKMASQLVKSQWTSLQIQYEGKVGKLSTHHVTLAIQKGLLENIHRDTLNYVNAPFLLEAHGIRTITSVKESEDFTSLIEVKIENGDTCSLRGTLFHSQPRIVQLGQYDLEMVPQGTWLVIQNEDVPGVIGQVGSFLGENKINISRMQLALDAEKSKALSLWNIEPAPSIEVMEKIRALPNILQVTQVQL